MHLDSSLTSILDAIKNLVKGATTIAHKLVLVKKQVSKLKAANKAATQRRLYKRKQLQKGETLTIKEGEKLATLKESRARGSGKKAKKGESAEVGEPSQRRCRRCGETRHNSRTYKQDKEVNSKQISLF